MSLPYPTANNFPPEPFDAQPSTLHNDIQFPRSLIPAIIATPPNSIPEDAKPFDSSLGSEYMFQYSQCTGTRKVHPCPIN
jgi:hypothetical protein